MPIPGSAGDYYVQVENGVDVFYPISSRSLILSDGSAKAITSSDLILGPQGQPPPPPPPSGTVQMGLSAVVGSVTSYDRTGGPINAHGGYQYWAQTGDADWSKVPGHYPNDWQWHIAAPMGQNLAFYRSMLATFPASHGVNVYVSGGQEKSNDPPYRTGGSPYVYNGALYISDTAPLRQAIYEARAAGKTYIIPSVSLLTQDVYAAGTTGYVYDFIATAGRDPNPVMHLMMSAYAGSKTSSAGHQVAAHDPLLQAKRLGDFAASMGLMWDASATGFSMPLAQMSDPISLQNRAAWMTAFFHAAVNHGAHFFGWFNSESANPSWQVQAEPLALGAWNQLLTDFGQV